MPIVIGFRSDYDLIIHFQDHHEDFGATTKEEYLAMAIGFLEKDILIHTQVLECIRANGDITRFDPITNEYGTVSNTGRIKTYFKPLPSHLAPPGTPIYKTHRFVNNMSYFTNTC